MEAELGLRILWRAAHGRLKRLWAVNYQPPVLRSNTSSIIVCKILELEEPRSTFRGIGARAK